MKIISFAEPELREGDGHPTMDINIELAPNDFHYAAIQVYGRAVEPVRAFLEVMGVPCEQQ